MADRKEYFKKYGRKRWQNNVEYREQAAQRRQEWGRKFKEEHGISYTTYKNQQLKQEIARLREQAG